jgi:hypothetical protein
VNTRRVEWIAAAIVLTLSAAAGAQVAPDAQPRRLDDRQRTELMSLIKQVDEIEAGRGAATRPFTGLSSFVLKGDGPISYLPLVMKVDVPAAQDGRVAFYLRVATRASASASPREESGLANWLVREAAAGSPRPVQIRGFFPVNPEEMPVGGGQMNSPSTQGAQIQGSFAALVMMEKEYERQREENAKARSTESTEKNQLTETLVFPFEDFDFLNTAASAGQPLTRGVALPPGSYDLYVALLPHSDDKPQSAPQPIIYRDKIDVAEPATSLAMSSVIVADRLADLKMPFRPEEQSAHPFALGWTEAIPATDSKFSDQQDLGVVFQVLNPAPDDRRKPDVTIEYSFFRKVEQGEHLEASPRRDYNRTTLPGEFDLSKGHQLLVAQPVPLKNFPPGDYRLEIKATDRKSGKAVSSDVNFSVIASPQSVWVEQTVQSMLAPPFQRNDVLDPELVGAALDRLAEIAPGSSTPPMADLVAAARAGRFAAVLEGLSTAQGDPATRAFLRGLALLGLNSNLDAAAGQFKEAVRSSSDFLAGSVYLGACYAAAGRDQDAVGAWQMALSDEYSTPVLHLLMADAFLRMKDVPAALDILKEATGQWPNDARVMTRVAGAHMIAQDNTQALADLEGVLAAHPDNADALFLAIYLLNRPAAAGGAAANAQTPALLARYSKAYINARGPYRTVVEQWIETAAASGGKP